MTNSRMISAKPIDAGALHDRERDPPPPHLLGQRPEHVPAVQRQEREQVDHASDSEISASTSSACVRADGEGLLGDRVAADDAVELPALLGLEDPRDRARPSRGHLPHLADARRRAAPTTPTVTISSRTRSRARPLVGGDVARVDREREQLPGALARRSSPASRARHPSTWRPGAAVARDLARRSGSPTGPAGRRRRRSGLPAFRYARPGRRLPVDRVATAGRAGAPPARWTRAAAQMIRRTRSAGSPPGRRGSPRRASTPAGCSRRGGRRPAGSPRSGSCR